MELITLFTTCGQNSLESTNLFFFFKKCIERGWCRGTLALHEKSKDINVSATMSKPEGEINLFSNFSVNANDFNILIPSFVKSKVSNKINIRIAAVLK